MGFDVVYLPPIHPIGSTNRKGPNNTLTPGPDDVGSPWAIGGRGGGHDAIHPDLGTIEDFDAFVARANELGLEVALDLALQATPDHPWVKAHPEWFTDARRRHASPTPRTRRRSTRTSTRSTSTATPRASTPRCLRVVRHWMDHGVRIFRVDNPHTKPVNFWEWLLARGPQDRPRRALPGRGVHPAGDDADAGAGRLPPVLHLLHLAQREVGARGVPHRAVPGDRPLPAAQLLRQHPRHPARLPAVRRPAGVQDPGRAGRDPLADVGRLLRLRAVRARRGAAGQRGVPRHREVPAPAARLGGRRGRGPHPRAVPHPAQRAPPQPPRAAAAAQPALPPRRQRPASSSTARASKVGDDGSATSCSSSSTSTRTGPARRRSSWTCRRSGWTGTTPWPCTTSSPARRYVWGQDNYVRLDPFVEPAHVFTVRADRRHGHRDRERRDHRGRIATRRSTTSPTCPRSSATRTGTSAPSSTRCWSGRSRTATATAPATSTA